MPYEAPTTRAELIWKATEFTKRSPSSQQAWQNFCKYIGNGSFVVGNFSDDDLKEYVEGGPKGEFDHPREPKHKPAPQLGSAVGNANAWNRLNAFSAVSAGVQPVPVLRPNLLAPRATPYAPPKAVIAKPVNVAKVLASTRPAVPKPVVAKPVARLPGQLLRPTGTSPAAKLAAAKPVGAAPAKPVGATPAKASDPKAAATPDPIWGSAEAKAGTPTLRRPDPPMPKPGEAKPAPTPPKADPPMPKPAPVPQPKGKPAIPDTFRYLPEKMEGKKVLIKIGPSKEEPEFSEYRVDNTEMQSAAPGIAFRVVKKMEVRDPQTPVAKWGSTILGMDDGVEKWVKWIKIRIKKGKPAEAAPKVVAPPPPKAAPMPQVKVENKVVKPPKDGKWECPACEEINKMERVTCNTCGKANPHLEQAEKPEDAEKKADETAATKTEGLDEAPKADPSKVIIMGGDAAANADMKPEDKEAAEAAKAEAEKKAAEDKAKADADAKAKAAAEAEAKLWRYLPKKMGNKTVVVTLGLSAHEPEYSIFRVDNTEMRTNAPGLMFRMDKMFNAKDTAAPIARWGSSLLGLDEGDNWIKCRMKPGQRMAVKPGSQPKKPGEEGFVDPKAKPTEKTVDPKAAPEEPPVVVPTLGKWECPGCGELNREDRPKCNTCQKDKPEGVAIIAPGVAAAAEKDTEGNFRAAPEVDEGFIAEAVPEPVAPAPPAADEDWECSGCGDMNRADSLRCITCNMDAPKAHVPAATDAEVGLETTAASAERWECPKCGDVNKPERVQCNGCGQRNPALPALPEKPQKEEDDHLRAVFVEPAAKKARKA